MDILPNQEFYLLAAVIDRAVRDAHGDATGLTGKAKTAAAEDARAFLAHVGLDWRRVHPRRVPERAHAWPDFQAPVSGLAGGKLRRVRA